MKPLRHPQEVIDHLFLKLAAIYGHLWRNLYKNQEFLSFAKTEWLDALSRFEVPLLYQALAIYRQDHPFPPSIPAFVACCHQLTRKDDFFPIRDEEVPPNNNPHTAKLHLAKMRDILGMQPR